MGERKDPEGIPHEEHAQARELLGPYVLGALDPEEEKAVERHLSRCAVCRDEERGLRETHERLAGTSIAASSAPPDLKARLLTRLPTRGGSGTVWGALRNVPRAGWVAAAAVLLLFALAVVAYPVGIFDRAEATATLTPTELAPGAGGEIRMRGSGPNSEASLEVWGLPQTGPNEYYCLWFGREEGRVSAGTFTVDGTGWGELSGSAPEMAGGYQRAGITLEEFPEEPRVDSARVVLNGDL